MDDHKTEPPAVVEELPVEDLDVDEAEAEAVQGGGGGNYDNGMSGGIKHVE